MCFRTDQGKNFPGDQASAGFGLVCSIEWILKWSEQFQQGVLDTVF